MNFYLIGIDYKKTSLKKRELAQKSRKQIEDLYRKLSKGEGCVIFTCNRIEFYGFASNRLQACNILMKLNKAFPGIFNNAYLKYGNTEAVRHSIRLACGFESKIIGESQILDQLKLWISQERFPLNIKKIWEEIIEYASIIRDFINIDNYKRDVADFTLIDLKSRLGTLEHKTIAVIGTGKIAELISMKNDIQYNIIFVARKKHSKAERFAKKVSGNVIYFDELPNIIHHLDAIISTTSSPHYVINKEIVSNLSGTNKTIYAYDLAIPRDIDPDIIALSNIKLICLEDLNYLIDEHNRNIIRKLLGVDILIEKYVKKLLENYDKSKIKDWNKTQLVSVKAG